MAGLKELAKLTGLKQNEVVDVFDAILNLIRSGERVIIRNFGSFWEITRKPRKVTSPVLKEGSVISPEKKVIRFRSAAATRRIVKARGKAEQVEP